MATIKITTLKCIRLQDVINSDEPMLFIAGMKVWDGSWVDVLSRRPGRPLEFGNDPVARQDSNLCFECCALARLCDRADAIRR